MSIIPDLNLVLVQLLPFFVMMVGLHVILFKPMLAYLAERETVTDGNRKSAHATAERADALLKEWEAAMERARNEITDYRTARRAEANTAYQKAVAAARIEVEARVQQAVAGIRADAETSRSDLARVAHSLSVDMSTQILGHAPGGEA